MPPYVSRTPCPPSSPQPASAIDADTDPLTLADADLAEMACLDATARLRTREKVICQCLGVARREALRYRNSGENVDDLIQVATVGLINAVDRFDPGRGVAFRHFAVPTITGELKRHFRDKGWSVRVTRRVQELYQEVSRAEPELAQRLGRTPTENDLADHLGLSTQDVRAARAASVAYSARSLDGPVGHDQHDLGELIGAPDRDLDALPDRDALHRALATLSERQRTLLTLRYVDELTQTQIADKLGVSQMHVSRLLSQVIETLRRHMNADRAWRTASFR